MSSIRFYNKFNELIKQVSENSGSAEETTLSRDVTIYVDVFEGKCDITFEMKDRQIGIWFPYQFDDGENINIYKRTLTEGKYRIILPTTRNEDSIRVNIKAEDVIKADVFIVPDYNQF